MSMDSQGFPTSEAGTAPPVNLRAGALRPVPDGEGRVTYRKLPGHRRGILRGASLWLAPDHLLSVKSVRFREEYKRFHLSDVQAIVVARTARFHISTRSLGIATLWTMIYLFTQSWRPWIPAALWSAAVLLVGVWVYISAVRSCRCRIFTAVSREDLPSLYRTWNVRKFLAEVEPRIREVQGSLPVDWAETLGSRAAGPVPPVRTAMAVSDGDAPVPAGVGVGSPDASGRRNRTMVSDLFVATLFANGLMNLATLHSFTSVVQLIWYALAAAQMGSAIVIFIQHYRGVLKVGMQKLAIVTLIVMGSVFYVRQAMAGIPTGNTPILSDPGTLSTAPRYVILREVDTGMCLVLGIVGLVIGLKADGDNEIGLKI